MTALAQALLFTLIFLCVYVIVDRICKCAETRAIAKSYGEFMKAQTAAQNSSVDWKNGIAQFYKEMSKNGQIRNKTGSQTGEKI